MKRQRVRKIKVRYISTSERKAEEKIDKFLRRVNAPAFDLMKELQDI